MPATDWVTISALATAGGTLVLAAATFASVRSANRAARAKGKPLTTMEEDEDSYEPAPVIAARESRLSRPAAQPVTQVAAEPSRPRTMLLEGLKEELFELEVEHKQGQISQQEYEKTKAALDQTLQRALKRESQKA